MIDSSERETSPADPRAREDSFRLLAESLPEIVWVTDPEGAATYMNQRWAEYTGVPVEQALPNGWTDAAHPDDRDRLWNAWQEAWRTMGRYLIEFRLRRHDGVYRWMLSRGSPALSAEGKPLFWAGTCTDVDDLKQALEDARTKQAALRSSEERYRFLFESSPLAKWLVDPTSDRVVAANDAALRLYGRSRGDFIGCAMRDLVEYARGTDGLIGLCTHRRGDGTLITFDHNEREVVIDGRRLRMVVAQDLTERRRLEEQLRQTQKMDALGRLSGSIAHDFNNVLMVMLSCARFAADDAAPDDPVQDHLAEVIAAGERAAALTRQLLSFGRAGESTTRVVDLNLALAELEVMLRRLAGEDIELTLALRAAPSRVRIDPTQLEQVLLNLVANARDAMRDGGALRIETHSAAAASAHTPYSPETDSIDYVLLVVADTGAGMTSATRERIFEPFFTTKEVGKGTGLGLATVYGIVREAGGRIFVDSEPGVGSTFRIFLPCAEDGPIAARPAAPPRSVARGTETILVAEDDAQVRAIVCSMLRGLGYRVIDASNAGEALLACEQHSDAIDLLLTDLVMPRMSGWQLAERLRRVRPGLRVVLMSGRTDDEHLRAIGRPGSEVVRLEKPFTVAELAQTIRQALAEEPDEDGPRSGSGGP